MITAVRLTNFKVFSESEIALGRYTLLSGLNSSGKSTVLQSLGLLRQALETHRGSTGREEQAAPHLPLNGEYVELGVGQDVLHEDYVGKQPRIGFELVLPDASVSLTADYEAEGDALPLRSRPFGSPGWSDPALSLGQSGFQYLRADRLNPAVAYPRSYEMSVRRGFLGTRGEYTVDFLRQHQDDLVAEPLLHRGAESRLLLAQTEAWLSEICPGVRLDPEAIDRTDLVRLGLTFVTTGRPVSATRRPTNVGFGISYVLPVIVACLTARPGAMLLLENPEAHVHPRGQSAMARLTCAAAAAGAQVVVETHSDHVLNGVRLAVKNARLRSDDVRLHYFRRGDQGAAEVVSPSVGVDGMLSDWPEGFFDEWDTTLDQLLD